MFSLTENYVENNHDFFKVGIYARLSREDKNSESIENQIQFLKPIVLSKPNWKLVDIYYDDGVSGTTFDRPGYNRLIHDVETNNVNLIIVKDLSRLGRNLLESLKFFEYCSMNNVRLIAVNDSTDSYCRNFQTDIMPVLRSFLNEIYSSDTSSKITSILKSKKEEGSFIGAFAPYGYLKDKQNKNLLVVNPETCEVVKRIYQMYIQGMSFNGIATILNQEHIMSPAKYKENTTLYRGGRTKNYLWNPETIKMILSSPTYAGSLSQGKLQKVSYKSKKFKNIPKEKWIVVEDTHEPLISKEDFQAVQCLMSKRNYHRNSIVQPHLLSGLIFCGDCGGSITFSRTGKYFYTMCSTYKRYRMCTRHTFSEEMLCSIIKQELRTIAEQILDINTLTSMAENQINSQINAKNRNTLSTIKKEIRDIEKRLTDIRKHIFKSYQDKNNGVITVDEFKDISSLLSEEKQYLNTRLNILKKKIEPEAKNQNSSDSIKKFVNDFASFKHIERHTIAKLIHKIEVFEDMTIKIHYNFEKPF
ncbi:recombinase family protein [Ruminiclostridium papyrosolvens]|uniref:Recombinase n=1 Tax=Ruminiclostridium papyrosolvens C7 TaxID=1330534 RepID=U4R3U7_9FIRM|nr:recombinase family protein [Ruminiclostridium papyrosolvens]EPR12513.1 hypothetical protein L323_08155 [Ruminiclostridium papyrosolvens C7]